MTPRPVLLAAGLVMLVAAAAAHAQSPFGEWSPPTTIDPRDPLEFSVGEGFAPRELILLSLFADGQGGNELVSFEVPIDDPAAATSINVPLASGTVFAVGTRVLTVPVGGSGLQVTSLVDDSRLSVIVREPGGGWVERSVSPDPVYFSSRIAAVPGGVLVAGYNAPRFAIDVYASSDLESWELVRRVTNPAAIRGAFFGGRRFGLGADPETGLHCVFYEDVAGGIWRDCETLSPLAGAAPRRGASLDRRDAVQIAEDDPPPEEIREFALETTVVPCDGGYVWIAPDTRRGQLVAQRFTESFLMGEPGAAVPDPIELGSFFEREPFGLTALKLPNGSIIVSWQLPGQGGIRQVLLDPDDTVTPVGVLPVAADDQVKPVADTQAVFGGDKLVEIFFSASSVEVRTRTLGTPPPPSDEWLSTDEIPGFEFQVDIRSGGESRRGEMMDECIGETLCVSGALPERAELFARVVGPKPNGFFHPTLVKASTSEVEVTVRQTATGEIRVYLLEGAAPGVDTLPGRVDKEGFEPADQAGQLAAPAVEPLRPGGAPAPATLPQLEDPEPPAGPWLTTPALPGFRVKVRITAGGNAIAGQKVPACIAETLCVSGALPGRAEVLVRVVGPKPNGKLWPTLVRSSTSRIEVWIQQTGSGEIAYYDMPAVTPGARFLQIDGLFARDAFDPL